MEKPSLPLFLTQLRDYLGSSPEHNQLVNFFDWLEKLAGSCSIKEKMEAQQIKNFLKEMEEVIKINSDTEFFLDKSSRISLLLDVILEENYTHDESMIRIRNQKDFYHNLANVSKLLASQ